MVKIGVHLLKL